MYISSLFYLYSTRRLWPIGRYNRCRHTRTCRRNRTSDSTSSTYSCRHSGTDWSSRPDTTCTKAMRTRTMTTMEKKLLDWPNTYRVYTWDKARRSAMMSASLSSRTTMIRIDKAMPSRMLSMVVHSSCSLLLNRLVVD